jgi:hypothetical protein
MLTAIRCGDWTAAEHRPMIAAAAGALLRAGA